MTLSDRGSILVLHVEDDSRFADLTAAMLDRAHDAIEVETVPSAKEGLERLSEASGEIDCIVSDHDMPGMNGVEFLETVREDHPDLPFVLFTGKGSEAVASEAISAGVTDYLQKRSGSEQFDLLANRVCNSVDGARAQRDRQRHLNAIETAQEGISIIDDDGYFIYVNETYADLHGHTSDGLIGEYWATLYPDEVVQRVREESHPSVAETGTWHGEMTGLHAGGSAFPADVAISASKQGGFVVTIRDISDEKHQKSELHRKTRAMDEAPVGITITDPTREDNPLIYVNDRFLELTGYEESEVLGRNCRFLQGEATDPEPVAELRAAIDAHETVSVVLSNIRKDGTEFQNRVTVAPVEDETGDVVNYVGFQEDITHRE
jgi:PAS domain S-box-containing protein